MSAHGATAADAHAAARTIIVGAGWSGLACAIRLVQAGQRPLLLEAAPQAGGRARTVEHELGGRLLALDNGQHLLLGAYRETLALMHLIGLHPGQVLARSPFALRYPDGWHLAARRLPAPWHLGLGLLLARGMTVPERLALARFTRAQQALDWRAAPELATSALLAGQPDALVRRLWRPLCLAALNVEPEHASAQIFLNVLRDSLGAGADASDLLVPRTDLSGVFVAGALRWLGVHGAQLRLHTPVLEVRAGAGGEPCRVGLRGEVLAAEHVVLALPPERAAALLRGTHARLDPVVAQLGAIRMAPICTTYLRYAPGTRLPHAYYSLSDAPAQGNYAQWVFDRGQLDKRLAGVLSAVVSGAGNHLELSRGALGQRVAAQLAAALHLPVAQEHYTLIEKQATIVPAPGLRRPPARLPLPGLFLAGDAADSPYPSTLEGSVRSGIAAAEALLERSAS